MQIERTIPLNLLWFPVLFVAWLRIAAESGSPVPHNWPQLLRISHALEVSFVVSLLLLMLAPVAWSAAAKEKRWVVAYPILLFLNCAATIAFSIWQLEHMPPKPPYAAPHHRCFRYQESMPPVDAEGIPIKRGELIIIWAAPGADGPRPDTPNQAFQREAWDGNIVVVTGFVEGGALRVLPTDKDMSRDEPHFCVWPDKVIHAPGYQ